MPNAIPLNNAGGGVNRGPSRRTTDSHCGHVSFGPRAGRRVFSELATATSLPLS